MKSMPVEIKRTPEQKRRLKKMFKETAELLRRIEEAHIRAQNSDLVFK